MAKEKFGIAVAEDTTQGINELVDECENPGANCSKIVEAILTAYIQSDTNHIEQVRGLIIRRGKGNL